MGQMEMLNIVNEKQEIEIEKAQEIVENILEKNHMTNKDTVILNRLYSVVSVSIVNLDNSKNQNDEDDIPYSLVGMIVDIHEHEPEAQHSKELLFLVDGLVEELKTLDRNGKAILLNQLQRAIQFAISNTDMQNRQ